MQNTADTTTPQPARPVFIERHDLAAWLDAATHEQRDAAGRSLFAYLMGDRMANYAYDSRYFRRLKGQRHRVKAHARRCRIDMLAKTPDEPRLSYCPERNLWRYTVGQSQNEEITNLIARLSGYKARGWLA